MRGGGEQVLDVVLVAQVAAAHTATAATLPAERVGGDRLHVAAVREHDDDLFVLDEVERVEIAGVDRELRLARVGVGLAHLGELVLDHRAELGVAREDRLELLDRRLELTELVAQLLALELGEPAELHVEDVVRLHLGELERRRHQARYGRLRRRRRRGSAR